MKSMTQFGQDAELDDVRVCVLGVGITPTTPMLAASTVEHWIQHYTPNYVCVTGVHGVMECQRDPALLAIHNNAGMVVPDGMPMVWASHHVGLDWVERVYGPDLMLELCRRSAARGHKVFLYGGADGTPELLSQKLLERFPALNIVGTHSPPFRALTDQEDDAIVAEINNTQADIVFVGLSTPKQERWMAQHQGRINATMLGVGAAFDFHAGTIKQAPSWMQERGLEWFFRLCSEPKRLYRRYLIGNPQFVAKISQHHPRLVMVSELTGVEPTTTKE